MKPKYRLIHITVKTSPYEIGNHLADTFDFYCPYSKRNSRLERSELMDLSIYDKIAAEEYKYYQPKQRINYTLYGEMEINIKVSDDEYAEIFYGCKDENVLDNDNEDLTKLFTYLNLKMFETFRTPEQFMKYTSLYEENTIKKDNKVVSTNKPEDNAIIFENILEHEIDWITEIAKENGCECKICWTSNYNPQMILETKPLYYEGFKIIARITTKDYDKALFTKHLIMKKLHNNQFLYDCYKGDVNDNSCKETRSSKI